MPKKKREIIERDGKFYTKRGTELTRASNSMSESEYFAFILSALRKATRFWLPKMQKLEEQKTKYTGTDKRIKWLYKCEICAKLVKRSEIEVDHITNCGGMNSYEKLVPWCQKAFVEKEGFQVICKSCHKIKTAEERKK